MKKIYLFITLFLLSCTTPNYTYIESSSDSENSQSDNYTSDNLIESEYVDSTSICELNMVDDHHVVYKTKDKEIDYFAEYIIDGEEKVFSGNIYINETRNQIGFLIINHGKLIFNDVTLLKDGDAYEPRNSLQYGKNALVTLINGGMVYFSNCAINIFSQGSSVIHLMNESSAIIEDTDITIVDEYSCAFSYYNNEEYVLKNNVFIFIDNDKSKESVIFYDD